MRSLRKIFLSLVIFSISCESFSEIETKFKGKPNSICMNVQKINKSEEEWEKELDPIAFRVTRNTGTEPAFTGQYYQHKEKGTYCCVCCGQPLFSSATKYESGTGWPSFWAPIDRNALELEEDRSYGMIRTEVKCTRCDAHLGHVFEDGPPPTGLRYCINSAALKFQPE